MLMSYCLIASKGLQYDPSMSTFGLGPFVITPPNVMIVRLRNCCAPPVPSSSLRASTAIIKLSSYCEHNLLFASTQSLHIQLNHIPTTTSINMQNERGQGVSHATDSQVPGKIQEKVHTLPIYTLLSVAIKLTVYSRLPPSSSTNFPTPFTTLAQTLRPARSATPPAPARSPKPFRRPLPRSLRRSSRRRSTPPSKAPNGYDTSIELHLS